jgi:hypothetical protein
MVSFVFIRFVAMVLQLILNIAASAPHSMNTFAHIFTSNKETVLLYYWYFACGDG